MTVDRRFFVDVFQNIVSEVRKKYDPIGLERPYFMYGHPIDIATQLKKKDNSRASIKKYPLICLLLDNPQKKGISLNVEYSVSPTVLILEQTLTEYISDDRTIKTFKPILYPIAQELLRQMENSPHLLYQEMGIKHTWTDKYYWGKEGIKMRGYDGLIFNDHLDGIQIEFTDLKIHKYSHCNT